ncbi:MAG TPA: hypothetical protein VMD08_17490 [Candidatus Baltobacteraceae bacterium]|nr:hypothetical protein [Candidatus Baltobacteraceae bacterium]
MSDFSAGCPIARATARAIGLPDQVGFRQRHGVPLQCHFETRAPHRAMQLLIGVVDIAEAVHGATVDSEDHVTSFETDTAGPFRIRQPEPVHLHHAISDRRFDRLGFSSQSGQPATRLHPCDGALASIEEVLQFLGADLDRVGGHFAYERCVL